MCLVPALVPKVDVGSFRVDDNFRSDFDISRKRDVILYWKEIDEGNKTCVFAFSYRVKCISTDDLGSSMLVNTIHIIYVFIISFKINYLIIIALKRVLSQI